MKTILVRTIVIAALTTIATPAFSQLGGGAIPGTRTSTVSGSGTVTIEKAPEVMRMQIDILFKSSSLKDALAGLKDRIDATRAQLVVLGAEKESIKVGSPKLSSAKSERQQQIEMMIAQRMKRLGKGNSNKKGATAPLTVSVELTAEWKLRAKTTEELLLASQPLQKKIREADLSGLKAASKLTPEEQELMEEMEDSSMYDGYGSSGEAKPGEPTFTFASPISKEEDDNALAEAYQKAKTQAARLAEAAGYELGKLTLLSGKSATSSDDESGYGYGHAYYAAVQRARAARNSGESQAEAVSVSPEKVKYQVTVMAGFELKEK